MDYQATYKILKGKMFNYLVGSNGFLFRYSNSSDLEQVKKSLNGSGYVSISVTVGGVREKMLHRVIYRVFKGKIPEGMEIHHKDQNKLNNSIDNLSTATRSQNNSWRSSERGSKHHASKFSQEDIDKIFKLRLKGISNLEISKRFSCGRKTIDNIVFGRSYLKETRKYKKLIG